MGVDESFETLVQLIYTSKPIKLGLLKYIGNLIGLLTWRIDKFTLLNRPRNLARPLCGIVNNRTELIIFHNLLKKTLKMNKVEVIEINPGTIIKSNDLERQIVIEINRFNDEGYKVVSTEIIKNKLNSEFKHAERLYMMVFLEKI